MRTGAPGELPEVPVPGPTEHRPGPAGVGPRRVKPLGETTEVATTNDIKNGTTLRLDGGVLWNVLEFQHVKPGKGGAFVRTKLKNVLTGKIVDKTFNAGSKVEFANVDRREMEYLYHDGEAFIFMDTSTYDQIPVPEAVVGDGKDFLLENTKVTVATNEGNPLYIELPAAVELEITQTDPGVQGDRSTGGTKPATVQTGATIQVPLFISEGERVKVDTRTGDYLGRVN
ncbi:Elongation factor P [Nocardiopsis dassonvillei]|nr:Elongation factor P [Nocardiopsis dassonvillei]